MTRFSAVVAVDGPSGSGKSTVCRRVAAALSAHYLDTGAMYRAVTVAVLRAGVDFGDADAITRIAESLELASGTDPAAPTIAIDGERVDVEIRGAQVTGAVSAVAAVAGVRSVLVAQQRSIIAQAVSGGGQRQGIVVEGRDIGRVVAPEAIAKIYLTASEQARAARRHAETTVGSQEATQQDLKRRDFADSSRATDPLQVPPDSVVLDSTDLSIDEAVAAVLAVVRERGAV